MRQRLLIVLTGVAAVAVLSFALPLSISDAIDRTAALVLMRSNALDRFADLADTAIATRNRAPLARAVHQYRADTGDPVLIVDDTGAPMVNDGVDPHSRSVCTALTAARRNQHSVPPTRLTPWSAPTLVLYRPVHTDSRVTGAVLLEASTRAVRADIAREWIFTGIGITIAMLGFGILALGLSRWILRPLAALSHAVVDLAAMLPTPRPDGDPQAARIGSIAQRYTSPPEIATLAESFDAMALAVTDAIEAQRQFVAATAHSLRNPLSALSVRLDSLKALSPPTLTPTVRGAEAEVGRLLGLLDSLLILARAETPRGFDPTTGSNTADDNGTCDAGDVAAGRIDSWRDAYHHAGRRLLVRLPEPVDVAIPAASLAQILDVALSNSYLYAGPDATTTVSIHPEADSALVTVADDGVGVDRAELDKLTTRFFRGTSAHTGGSGLGLSIATALAHRYNAELTVEPVAPHGLAVALRLRREEEDSV